LHPQIRKKMDLKIDVRQLLRSKLKGKAGLIPAFVVNYLVRIVHQDELNYILCKYRDLEGVDFMDALVNDYFHVNLEIKNENNLPPADGRYIFVSNHPLGGFDGICLTYLIGRRYDNKVRYLVNDLLMNIPNLRSIFVPVNKLGAQSREIAVQNDMAYSSDNQIITFPAGLCSRKSHGIIRDLEWKKSFIQRAVAHQRDVVPIYFEGRNSDFFYRLANFRKLIRLKFNIEMLFLSDELFKMKNKSFTVHIGVPVSYKTFDASKKPVEWAEWMRNYVYKIAEK